RAAFMTVAAVIVAASLPAITVVFNSQPARATNNHIYIADSQRASSDSSGSEPAKERPESSESRKAKDAPIASDANRPQKKKEDLPNFHEVHPFLFRGGEPNAAGIKKLKEMGVKTLIDLRNPGEKEINEKNFAEENGMKYISMPMS